MLKAFLRTNGQKSVDQFDANIDAFYFFTKVQFIRKCHSTVVKKIEKLESGLFSSSRAKKEIYNFLCEADLYFTVVIKNINKSISYFTSNVFSDIEEYNFHKNVIERAFDIISAAYYPTQINTKDFAMRFSNQVFKEIIQATKSKENPYIEYYNEALIGRIGDKGYSVVGVSVTALSQIIPALTLAALLKKQLPRVKIIFGGQVFNRLEENIKQLPVFFRYVDYLILGEGETPLLELLGHIEGIKTISEVPNLMYFDKGKKLVVETEAKSQEDVSQFPSPDYDGLPLSRYLSPAPVLSYQPARGCYWNKCTFCNQYLIAGKGLRSKNAQNIVKDLKFLSKRYNTSYFSIVNESLPPATLRSMSEVLIKEQQNIKWYAGARFDNAFDRQTLELMKKSGCEKLYLGLESGYQATLNEMNKGIILKNVRQILHASSEIGIGIHLFIMIGFPTETEAGFEYSRQFIREIVSLVDKNKFSHYISVYQLKPQTPVIKQPDQFNIKTVFKREGYDLEYLYGYDRLDSPLNVDYERARGELEMMIDDLVGPKSYPENISHFLTFNNTQVERKESKPTAYYIGPHLAGKLFKNYAGLAVTFLIYDFCCDNLFTTSSEAVMRYLLSLKEDFTDDEFVAKLVNEFKIEADDVNLFFNDLKRNHIIKRRLS